MVQISGPPSTAWRCRPISDILRNILVSAADSTGIDRIVITSGGQSSDHPKHLEKVPCGWTGSRRHDNGRAADLIVSRNGNFLSFTNSNGNQVADFITACAARGATGIGAATDYMGPRTMHIGFGLSASDTRKLTWGRDGASANAPNWLRVAARNGWDNPVERFSMAFAASEVTSRSVVTARDGLWLRRGPGLNFDRARLLAAGTPLWTRGLDGEWARVDLEGDGHVDGHVHAAFIGKPNVEIAVGSDDPEEEPPLSDADIAALIRADSEDEDAATAMPTLHVAKRRQRGKKRSGG